MTNDRRTIAAIYVLPDGPYVGLPGVDPWPESRDARLYPGPYPVVAHPPCARWGRYWYGSPTGDTRYKLGEDGGCFAAAIAAVRRWGGVLEHPEGSHAWRAHGIRRPPRNGGWVRASLWDPGWTCCVEQGHYGHKARKATWLYVVGMARESLPDLRWGRSWVPAARTRTDVLENLSHRQRLLTPEPFRDLLIDIARGCLANQEQETR